MRCLILGCQNEAERWFRIDQVGEPFMTASCARCEEKVLDSVVGPQGRAVTGITHDEFLVTEVMESMEVLRADMELGNGRLLYSPVLEDL